MRSKWVLPAAVLATAGAPAAFADFIDTSDAGVYSTFATGATVQNFDSVAGLTPLGISSYANTTVPATAQLGGQIAGLHFHSGGASFNDPVGNPGTPAALLSLLSPIDGDARSGSGVVGSLEINTDQLNVSQFIEIVFTNSLQSRVGVWLNPSLGNVLVTAFDSTGTSLESGTGTAGNFVGFQRAAADIKFISIINVGNGFTIDDLTYAGTTTTPPPTNVIPEPATLALVGAGLLPLAGAIRRRRA
jgi:hypothetical protein